MVEVTCVKCGHKNPLGRVFCMSCGTKLDLAGMSPKFMRASAQREGKALGRVVRLVITLALLLAIILILRPVLPTGSAGNAQDAQRLRQKLGLLKGAAMDGQGISQPLSEVEINSYLAEQLKRTAGDSPSGLYSLRTINVAMVSGKIVVVLVSAVGPASLSYEMVGGPARTSDHHFTYELERVRLGHLPMPGPLGDWVAGQVYNVFSKKQEERDLLDRMARIEVGQHQIVASTQVQP